MTVGEAVEAAATNQLVIAVSNGEMDGMAVLGGRLGGDPDEMLSILQGVRIGNTEGGAVDVFVVQVFGKSRIVPRPNLGQVNTVSDFNPDLGGFVAHHHSVEVGLVSPPPSMAAGGDGL